MRAAPTGSPVKGAICDPSEAQRALWEKIEPILGGHTTREDRAGEGRFRLLRAPDLGVLRLLRQEELADLSSL